MSTQTMFAVGDYWLSADRYYDASTHLWVQPRDAAPGPQLPARCGLDPLGSDTTGDIVAVSFEPVGTRVERGEPFGSLEAAKFVGPLTAPVSGTIAAHNPAVLANPGLINRDPLEHWLVEIEGEGPEEELARLLRDPAAVRDWFEREIERFRQQGTIAE